MNKKSITIIIALVIVTVMLGAGLYNFISNSQSDNNLFGYTIDIKSTNSNGNFALPFVQSNNTLSFKTLATNSTILNPQNMELSGWGAYMVTSSVITVLTNLGHFNNTTITDFVQIQNPLAYSVQLSIAGELPNVSVVSYDIQSPNSSVSGYLIDVINGTNNTIVHSNNTALNSHEKIVGKGHLFTANTTVIIPAGEELNVYLSILPNSNINETMKINTTDTGGYIQIIA